MVKIVISGCCGRMGSRIAALAREDHSVQVTGALEAAGHPKIGKDLGEVLGLGEWDVPITGDLDQAVRGSDVLIEFTTPLGTVEHAKGVERHKKAMVIGTTGLSPKELEAIEQAARAIPIVFSPNMSVGVNVLFELVREAAVKLGRGYQVEVVEAHHRHKKDAPSGTAKKLAEIIAAARGKDEAGIHSIRAGEIVGDHTVLFCGPGERLELVHRADSRDTFAAGALRAAKFVAGKKPGLYTMADVLEATGGCHSEAPEGRRRI